MTRWGTGDAAGAAASVCHRARGSWKDTFLTVGMKGGMKGFPTYVGYMLASGSCENQLPEQALSEL